MWENHKVEDVASPEGWEKDPSLVLNFYSDRFEACNKAEPNEAHKSIARLQEKFKVINITQNVDNLLERAGCNNVVHLHGSLGRRKCEKHKDSTVLDGDINFTCDYKDNEAPAKIGDTCPKCNSRLRPDVVWFGEAVNMPWDDIQSALLDMSKNNGVFICVGTSAQVYPASSLLQIFYPLNNKYIVDLKPIGFPGYELIEGLASEQMKLLAGKLLSE